MSTCLPRSRADREEGSVEPAVLHGRREVVDALRTHELDAEGADPLDLGRHDVTGQAVGGDAVAHHAAGQRRGLEDHHLVPAPPEVVGGGQASGSRPDDEDTMARGRRRRLGSPAFGQRPVAQEALDGVDAHRLVHRRPVARGLAWVEAGAPHDGGQRVVQHDLAPGRLVGAVLGQVQPLLDVLARRAGVVARGQAVDVHRPLHPPRAGLVGQAGADLEGDGEGLLHHGAAASGSSSP